MKRTGTVLVFTNSGTSAYILPYVVDTGPVSVGPGEIEPHSLAFGLISLGLGNTASLCLGIWVRVTSPLESGIPKSGLGVPDGPFLTG